MSLLSLTKKIVGAKKPADKAAKKPDSQPKIKQEAAAANNVVLAGEIGLSVILSERSISQQAGQTLVVRVLPHATKPVIAKAVEGLFRVKVLSVRTSRLHPKRRQRGTTIGRTQHWKKAYVTVDDISKLHVAP
ncbi:MAG: 50S ribosomal protein L23 [Candidatus Andersenbacteria bacterium]|nr:50S ribosomal protein L23 [Candidatus Andersenbacteria bacterium]